MTNQAHNHVYKYTQYSFYILYSMPSWVFHTQERKHVTPNQLGWRVRCFPYFLLIGFTKSGTSDLRRSLSKLPDFVPGIIKEPKFWNKIRLEGYLGAGWFGLIVNIRSQIISIASPCTPLKLYIRSLWGVLIRLFMDVEYLYIRIRQPT